MRGGAMDYLEPCVGAVTLAKNIIIVACSSF